MTKRKTIKRPLTPAEIDAKRPKIAIVIKDISPIMKVGDILFKNAGAQLYVKQGEKPKMIESTVRFGLFGLKRMTVMTPNHYIKEHVENLPEYFQIKNA